MYIFNYPKYPLLVILLLLGYCGQLAFCLGALKVISDRNPIKASSTSLREHDLAMIISDPAGSETEIFSEALKLIASIQESTSCYKLATAHLLVSCREFDGSVKGPGTLAKANPTPITLENIKEIYAARLAICELQGAGAPVPTQCSPLVPQKGEKQKPHLRRLMHSLTKQRKGDTGEEEFDSAVENGLSQCLKSLESRPQWWMSYSNSRQNAVIMCQAARAEVEKDELLEIHRTMAGVASEINGALSKTLKVSKAEIHDQKAFAEIVKAFQKSIVQDMEATKLWSQSFFKQLVNDMGDIILVFRKQATSAGEAVTQELQHMKSNIQASVKDIQQLRGNFAQVFEDAKSHSSEFAKSQSEDLTTSHELISGLQETLVVIKDAEMQGLLSVIGDIQSHLKVSNDLVSVMHERQNSLDGRIETLNKAFEQLEAKAISFHAAQSQQAETQNQLGESLRSDILLAQSLLSQVNAAAKSLQSTVEETSARVSELGLFSGLSGTGGRWSWLMMVTIGFALFSRRTAGAIAITVGAFSAGKALYHPLVKLGQPAQSQLNTTSLEGIQDSHLAHGPRLVFLLYILGVVIVATAIIIIIYILFYNRPKIDSVRSEEKPKSPNEGGETAT
ncbi:hypothetical protein L228DRAFT_278254 [Xylona heveae TC161]|uniref:Nuclear membrane fusion protein Kar5 n=1 Tax=Xylona heveae (strain CBS 132557 / TC161) TaxID=1328760 RepID=A0A165FKR9_XYLHT|nr:hypothetical protein L228DRAFT_278254 [Xylona heveae TC161]KZF21091.1 hypothetical protein L228DRAFT_278254 [Xylona heveae TC161]